MKRLLATLVLLTACEGKYYDRSELVILTSFAAKETCSCVFVIGQSDVWCKEYAKQSPPFINALDVNHEEKVVTAHGLGAWTARARFVSDRAGCVLEAP